MIILKRKKMIEYYFQYLIFLEVNGNGQVNLDQIERKILEIKPDILSVMWANNETGVIQPINEIAEIAKKNLYVGCAPDTFLGAVGQKARNLIEEK